MGTIDHQSLISSDSNNNTTTTSVANVKKIEKYSLRKRHKRGTNIIEADDIIDDRSDFVIPQFTALGETKLGLRASKARTKKEKVKTKTKAEPLSKYRRKTANARERTRMREINSAFETLRNCVPVAVTGGPAAAPHSPSNEKLTKITTLRFAMKYITLLSDSLRSNRNDIIASIITPAPNHISTINHNYHQTNTNDSISVTKNNQHINNKKSKKINNNINNPTVVKPAKSSRTSSTTRKKISSSSSSSLLTSQSSLVSSASKKLIFPPPLPPQAKKISSPSSFTSIPTTQLNDEIFTSYQKYLDSDFLDQSTSPSLYYDCHSSSLPSTSSDSNDLEFGLILESDGESLQFSEPCLSPLAPLDGLSPFSDILSPSFTEQTTLDMYLT